MDERLVARVPRGLRVRASLQIAGTRIPARGFVVALGGVFLGGAAVVAGADPAITLQLLAALVAALVVAIEGRWWGYPTWELARIVVAHLARPGRLEPGPTEILVRPEQEAVPLVRRPRWQGAAARGGSEPGRRSASEPGSGCGGGA